MMRQVIYYPGFEVNNKDWLKFALLYLDRLHPIIPPSGEAHLTSEFRLLKTDTDLIHIHKPTYAEGETATFDALDHVEKILRNPGRYTSIFHEPNVVEAWQAPENQTSILYEEKYAYPWRKFCLENKLARASRKGLRLPRQLALLYMTLLAQSIADVEGLSPLTDYASLDRFSVFTRKADPTDIDALTTAQVVLQLKLPADIHQLSLASIVRHRNRPGFKERQKAFHDELDKFIDATEDDRTPERFGQSLGSLGADFTDDVLHVGTGAIAFGLGVWILLKPSEVGLPPAIEKIAGGAAFAIGSSISIRKNWRHTRTKRYARRYLADLTKLQPTTID